LLAADSGAIYAPPGYLLFVRQGTLFAQPFDAVRSHVTGEPVAIAQSIPAENGAPGFSASHNGVLTYRTGPVVQDLQLAWFDRTGHLLDSVGAPGNYRGVDLSSEGNRIAVHRHDGNGGDIWVIEPRSTMTRLTFEPSQDNSSPAFSPDGSRIAYGSRRNGKIGVYAKASDGTGPEELLVESDVPKIPAAWSSDGTSLVYWLYDPKTGSDQWMLPLAGARKPTVLLDSRFAEGHSQVSPDGKWLAYMSDQTGRQEIYVKPFPSGDGLWQISAAGGVFPRWRRDGREVFFFSQVSLGKLMAAPVGGVASRFEAGAPHPLFDSGYREPGLHSSYAPNYHTYAVSPANDFSSHAQRPLVELTSPHPSTVVLNWTAGLKK
jgi:dipeptidyl aminopeptidase/acylaminoacyl peptidase